MVLGVAAAPVAGEQAAPPGPSAGTASSAAPTSGGTGTFVVLPEPTEASSGTYSYPRWLPLRRDLSGAEVKVGCTLDSHGSQHGYECSGHHDRWAIDFIAATGTDVYAAGAGFATNLTGKPGGSGFGNVISIDHGFGITSLYAHLSEAYVPPEGTWVDETTLLGKVGQTGSASTPHLHFEEFSNPGGSNSANPVSIDPGPLFACRGHLLVSFPQVAGFDTWAGLAWGSLTVASDGDTCITDATRATATANDDIPDDGAPAASSQPKKAAGASSWWSDVLAPLLNLVGSTGTRLHLPG